MSALAKLKKYEIKNKKKKEVLGGLLFGLVCITGVLDGVPNNTKAKWFRKCKPPLGQPEVKPLPVN